MPVDPMLAGSQADPSEDTSAGQLDTPSSAADSIVSESLSWYAEELKDLPADKRDRIIGKLKGYDKDYLRKTQELAQEKQLVKEAIDNLKVIQDQAASTSQKAASTREKTGKILDDLEDSTSDPSLRETYRVLRKAIEDHSPVSSKRVEQLEQKVTELTSVLQTNQQAVQLTHRQSVEKELPALDKKYGVELIERHREKLIPYAVKYNISATRALYDLADPDELEQALEIQRRRLNGEPKKPSTSSVTSTSPKPDSDQYRGKTPGEIQRGFDRAIVDSVRKAKGVLGIK